MDALAPIVTLHACSGAIALASFWCAAVLRKGSRLSITPVSAEHWRFLNERVL